MPAGNRSSGLLSMQDRAVVESVVEFFRQHEPVIRTLISRRVRCRQDAEDMYQNLFLYLILRPPPDQTYLLAYLSKAIHSYATDATRHAISYGSCVTRYATLQRDHTLDKEPEHLLVQMEQIRKLTDIIESALPPHIAQAIIERYLHGRTIRETAVQLGIEERTVSHYCCTGLRRIRQLVQEGKIEISAV
jgi:RNA polymerase sigma factor (sigma-70 family)